jgi:hypothetical protein
MAPLIRKAKKRKSMKVNHFHGFSLSPKVQNTAKNNVSGGVIGDFFETIKNSHQSDFISLMCSILHKLILGLFP